MVRLVSVKRNIHSNIKIYLYSVNKKINSSSVENTADTELTVNWNFYLNIRSLDVR